MSAIPHPLSVTITLVPCDNGEHNHAAVQVHTPNATYTLNELLSDSEAQALFSRSKDLAIFAKGIVERAAMRNREDELKEQGERAEKRNACAN